MSNDLEGLWVPLITPFDRAGDVDLGAVVRLAERVLGQGARGLVVLGTTGEPSTLIGDERQTVIDACASLGAPMMVGTGTNCTRITIEWTRALGDVANVAAALVVVPYYTRPSQAAVVEHFRMVAAESPVPIVAYNIPYRTGRGLEAEHLLALAEIDGIIGVKQSVGALDADTLEVLRRAPPKFAVLAGDDAFIAPTVLMGGVGAIAAAAHVCTSLFASMVAAANAGQAGTARRYAEALLPVVEAGFSEPSPALWKAALHRRGEIDSAALRAPMSRASHAATERLLAAVDAVSS